MVRENIFIYFFCQEVYFYNDEHADVEGRTLFSGHHIPFRESLNFTSVMHVTASETRV